jgi:hypothetical protein
LLPLLAARCCWLLLAAAAPLLLLLRLKWSVYGVFYLGIVYD